MTLFTVDYRQSALEVTKNLGRLETSAFFTLYIVEYCFYFLLNIFSRRV